MSTAVDAVVVGAGPNGLAAAITLARAGRSVTVLEAGPEPGGGLRSAELTLPGFVHDICSAIHPLGAGSPFFRSLGLGRHGLRWIEPEVALAHPLDGGRAGALHRSTEDTLAQMGEDAEAFARWIAPHSRGWDDLAPSLLAPIARVPRHPYALARFGIPSLAPATVLGKRIFRTDEARGVFAGCAAHAFMSLRSPMTSSFGLMLAASAGAVGWPMVAGGSARLSDALVAELEEHGGTVECGRRVTSMSDLPPHRAVLFDIAPRQVAAIAGDALAPRYRRRLERFRLGPAVFKVDHALSGPVPWEAEACRKAGTVHIGGTIDEIADSERAVADGRIHDRPFMLVAQQSLADPSRAPAGQHTLWSYCHIPNGSVVDMTTRMEAQIERFAPGFRDLILARHVAGPAWYERHNRAYIGGDITGGAYDGLQIVFRPTIGRSYRTTNPSLFLCGAATPPGGGVHGMCGHHSANVVLSTALR